MVGIRRFPIQDGPSVPWDVMVPHDRQCQKNHGGQTLEHIASRGGLSPCEAWWVVNGIRYDGSDFKEARRLWFEYAERINLASSVTNKIKPLEDAFDAYRLLVDMHMQAVADRLDAIEKRLLALEERLDYPVIRLQELDVAYESPQAILYNEKGEGVPWLPIKEIE